MADESNASDYWEARLTERYDLTGVGYAGLGREYNACLYRLRCQTFLTRVASYLGEVEQARVLDIGSGTGFYIELWKQLGVGKLVGSDLTSVAVEQLALKYPAQEFYRLDIGGDLGELRNEKFDYISAFDVLFHIMNDEQYLTAIRNVSSLLEPGGLFIFSENFVQKSRSAGPAQVSRTLDTIQSYLLTSGFIIVDRFPMFWMMNAPVDSDNSLLKLWWRLLSLSVSRHELAGRAIGRALYPLEYFLIRHLRESPTTEIMICSK